MNVAVSAGRAEIVITNEFLSESVFKAFVTYLYCGIVTDIKPHDMKILALLAAEYNLVHLKAMADLEKIDDFQKISYPKDIIQHLESHINNPTFSDVTFLVEGQTFFVHRAILCARSDYFSSLLTSEMKEASQTVIDLTSDGIPQDIFLQLMRWIYTENHSGLEELKSDGALSLITWADRWLLRDLVSSLERSLCAGDPFCLPLEFST
jgi:hypothetical protein